MVMQQGPRSVLKTLIEQSPNYFIEHSPETNVSSAMETI